MQRLFDRDYADRWKPGLGPDYSLRPSRPLLSPSRSLGSVIKLLTPSDDYTPEYNAWLASFPDHIYPLVFLIKRYVAPQAGANWRDQFGVDSINGRPGHELKAMGRRLVGSYLRVGLLSSQGWRTFKLRQDFAAGREGADRGRHHRLGGRAGRPAPPPPGSRRPPRYKFAVNCEYRLFQRPDDAVHRGLDRQTEADLARPDNFLSNFEPLTAAAGPGPRRPGHRVRRVHPAHARAAVGGGGRFGQPSSARPTRGWSMASRARTRATCRPARTCWPPRPATSPSGACAWLGASPAATRCPCPSAPC